jgi:hypothetical protein
VNPAAVSVTDSLPVIRVSDSKRRVDDSATAVVAVTGGIGEVNECACECDIEYHFEERKDCDAAETPYENACENRVQDRGSGNTFYGTQIGVDVQAMAGKDSEEVGENSEDDRCAAKFDDAQEKGDEFESETAECHFDDGFWCC